MATATMSRPNCRRHPGSVKRPMTMGIMRTISRRSCQLRPAARRSWQLRLREREFLMWIRKCDLDAVSEFRPPIPTRIVSNEEFVPPPQSRELAAVDARLTEIAERNSRRLGIDRRSFLGSACGMAAALAAFNEVFGPFYQVRAEEMEDPKAFEEKWPKDQ